MAYLFGDANAPSAGKMSGVMAMNRCPTVAEAIEILEAGVPEADRGASQVPVYAGQFSDNDGWSGAGMTVTGGHSIGGETNCLKIECTSTGSSRNVIRTISLPTDKNSAYRVKAYRPSGGPTTNLNLRVSANLSNVQDLFAATLEDDDWVDVTSNELLPSVGNDASRLRLYFLDGFSKEAQDGDIVYLKIVQVDQTGVTADLPPSSLQLSPGLWLDESGNGKHPVLPDGMRVGEAKTEGVLFAENEFTASAIGQPICADVAVLPADYQVTLMMKATVEATFNIGDGSVADYYASGVTIGTGWAPVALSEHASDGTNRKIVVTPTASYSGVVSTKVKVERLI